MKMGKRVYLHRSNGNSWVVEIWQENGVYSELVKRTYFKSEERARKYATKKRLKIREENKKFEPRFRPGDKVRTKKDSPFQLQDVGWVKRYSKNDPDIVIVKRVSDKGNVWFKRIPEEFLEPAK